MSWSITSTSPRSVPALARIVALALTLIVGLALAPAPAAAQSSKGKGKAKSARAGKTQAGKTQAGKTRAGKAPAGKAPAGDAAGDATGDAAGDDKDDAPKVRVERGRGGRKVYRITQGFVIEGRIQKPNAFYVLQRSQINYDWADLKQQFVPRITEAVRKSPF